ncbi:uncharacterized protein BXZ73DRAFT_49672 [Epithele typhae]|uniref:uncharacterized protein n=1 Tax=Epithele typhae TaxID=378194 RepID=UPI0020078FDA|nr:uncharacterized protein BXZ73DRAFT_49672 [Epithele typhae]KAH9925888.1 hypothetical protein BXZ73DRAFT_49672 [Epithele typhae]
MDMSLFPIPFSRILTGFTTCPTANIPNVHPVDLLDKPLGVHKATSKTPHHLVVPPIPVPGGSELSPAWEACFSNGSINPGNKTAPPGGFGFYLHGPLPFAKALKELGDEEEVIFSYDVLFDEGFEWVKGGKLPGIYGGAGDSAYGCTGGRQEDRCRCFDLRLMWRENAVGELYAYLPHHDKNTERLMAVPPKSIRHPDYGFSVGRGALKFESGRWMRIAERVKVNDVGKEDGEIEVFVDGRSVMHANGLVIRTEEGADGRVQGLHMQTFFGGHSPDWASPKDQRAWFANISGAILKRQVRHNEL